MPSALLLSHSAHAHLANFGQAHSAHATCPFGLQSPAASSQQRALCTPIRGGGLALAPTSNNKQIVRCPRAALDPQPPGARGLFETVCPARLWRLLYAGAPHGVLPARTSYLPPPTPNPPPASATPTAPECELPVYFGVNTAAKLLQSSDTVAFSNSRAYTLGFPATS
jgi:hypothetical protein